MCERLIHIRQVAAQGLQMGGSWSDREYEADYFTGPILKCIITTQSQGHLDVIVLVAYFKIRSSRKHRKLDLKNNINITTKSTTTVTSTPGRGPCSS